MKPYFSDDWLTILEGDCRAVLPSLPADSVDCVVTSPPYWGLRDYGTEGQLGLERTPEEYVANLVAVFAEVRRVLKPSGTCWLNLGDSYNSSSQNNHGKGGTKEQPGLTPDEWAGHRSNVPGLKPKDLVGIPWRVAFALQADGWYLRSDIVWAKPNPMPESVTDRPTKAHEMVFLLTKSARYYFDSEAVREPHVSQHGSGNGYARPEQLSRGGPGQEAPWQPNGQGRNIRSVWSIATRPYPGAHFAVFPPELPERCIKAGSSERGVCPECGAPWERVVELGAVTHKGGSETGARAQNMATVSPLGQDPLKGAYNTGKMWAHEHHTTGWRPSCTCQSDKQAQAAVVLDPFAGSGTVGMVANRLSRRAILIDLNPEYLRQQMTRNAQTPLGLGAA